MMIRKSASIPRSLLTCLVALLTGSVMVGCEFPLVEQPIGQRLPPEKLFDFKGVWWDKDAKPLILEVTKDGMIAGNLVFDKSREQFEADNLKIVVTEIGNQRFCFFEVQKDEQKTYLAICLVEEMTNQRLSIRMGDCEPVAKAIESGELRGQFLPANDPNKKRGLPLITADETEFKKFLEKNSIETLFPEKGRIRYFRLPPNENQQPAQ